jgi:hypothetical protein
MKTSNPYGPGMPVKYTPETVTAEMAKDGGKFKARYPSGIPSNSQKMTSSGPVKHRAFTPGGPTGS